MVETSIEAIRINVVTDEHIVILKEVNGTRFLPIWIGAFEAQAIAWEIKGTEIGRPMTHDLLRSAIEEMGGSVERVVVNDLRERTFYALITIHLDGRTLELDSRPSDAIALAVRTHSPIFVEDHVMEQTGIPMAEEGPEEREAAAPGESRAPSEELDPEKLSVFRDFINNLDINLDVDDPERGKD